MPLKRLLPLALATLSLTAADTHSFALGLHYAPGSLVAGPNRPWQIEGNGKGLSLDYGYRLSPRYTLRAGLLSMGIDSSRNEGGFTFESEPALSALRLALDTQPFETPRLKATVGLGRFRYQDTRTLDSHQALPYGIPLKLQAHLDPQYGLGLQAGLRYQVWRKLWTSLEWQRMSLDKERTGMSHLQWTSVGIHWVFGAQ